MTSLDLSPSDKILIEIIQKKMEEVAVILMNHENKNYCLASVNYHSWRELTFPADPKNESSLRVILVPSPAFSKLITPGREYFHLAQEYPESFGTGNAWDIVKAIHKHYEPHFINRSDEEFLTEFLSKETMAYLFRVNDDGSLSDKILRIDLCRDIRTDNNQFQGGLFHAIKHFSIEGYDTVSTSTNREFELETVFEVYGNIARNFFLGDLTLHNPKNNNSYLSITPYKDGYDLRGLYYKEPKIPVHFLDTIHVVSHK